MFDQLCGQHVQLVRLRISPGAHSARSLLADLTDLLLPVRVCRRPAFSNVFVDLAQVGLTLEQIEGLPDDLALGGWALTHGLLHIFRQALQVRQFVVKAEADHQALLVFGERHESQGMLQPGV